MAVTAVVSVSLLPAGVEADGAGEGDDEVGDGEAEEAAAAITGAPALSCAAVIPATAMHSAPKAVHKAATAPYRGTRCVDRPAILMPPSYASGAGTARGGCAHFKAVVLRRHLHLRRVKVRMRCARAC